MWTVGRLKAWAEERGHAIPGARAIQEALLAHERYWKRTAERNIDRNAAKVALDSAIDRLEESEIPPKRSNEYPGMTELRVYAQERHRQRAEAKRLQQERERKEAATPEQAAVGHEGEPERDEDRER